MLQGVQFDGSMENSIVISICQVTIFEKVYFERQIFAQFIKIKK